MSKKQLFAASFSAVVMAISTFGVSAGQVALAADDPANNTPTLSTAVAMNTGGTSAEEAGDSVVLTFSETTNKFAITAANIATELSLDNSHSFLDGAGALGSADWSDDGTMLTITLSSGTSLPTVVVGDKVTVSGSDIKDTDGNAVTGNATISGSFTDPTTNPCDATMSSSTTSSVSGDNNLCGEQEHMGKFRCGTGLQNGRLYKTKDSPTVYLLAACRFMPFRGIAAFHSRGLKFQDIIVLDALPSNLKVSDKPVVPAEGTLVKGSDKTVWFVSKNGKRKGFVSADVFTKLGFSFKNVDQISDSDLSTIQADTNVSDDTTHPDGALIKCGNSAAVFEVIGNLRFPFADATAFQERGHSFEHVLVVDCGRFAYKQGAAITQ